MNHRQYHRLRKRLKDRIWAAYNDTGNPFERQLPRLKARLRRIENFAQAQVLQGPQDLNREAAAERRRRDEDDANEHHWNRLYRRQERFDERSSSAPE